MNKVIIGLGSNIDPERNIERAKSILAEKYNILAESRFQKTKAIGKVPQDDFINGTVLIDTLLNMDELKSHLKAIESNLGRQKNHDQNASRTIDLDIIVWNGSIVDRDFYTREHLKQSVLDLIPELPY